MGFIPHFAGYVAIPDKEVLQLFRHQTGDFKTVMTQSQAGLGTQGPVIRQPKPAKPIPAPTHPDMPDA